jgi:hypothetical protein
MTSTTNSANSNQPVFEWTCTNGSKNLHEDDDYVCQYKTLTLRAERMSIDKNNESWWWGVYENDKSIEDVIKIHDDQYDYVQEPTSGEMARLYCETVALNYIKKQLTNYNNSCSNLQS